MDAIYGKQYEDSIVKVLMDSSRKEYLISTEANEPCAYIKVLTGSTTEAKELLDDIKTKIESLGAPIDQHGHGDEVCAIQQEELILITCISYKPFKGRKEVEEREAIMQNAYNNKNQEEYDIIAKKVGAVREI